MLRSDIDPDLRLRESEEDPTQDGGSLTMLAETDSLILPTGKGKSVVREDGTVKVAIIRPCVSRGKKIRGLPPIYTPAMLAENASKFSGWPMFMDHVTEGMQEALRKRGRSVNELGGRVVESWWDPTFTHPDDEKTGHVQGAVLGYVLPQPGARAMIEADPEILRCSINAWPTGATPGRAPWNGKDGMLIEGISEEPPGSVDWVIRAGAGGRVLQEQEDLAVCILEAAYGSAHDRTGDDVNFADMTPDEIRSWLKENKPEVLVAAPLAEEETAPKKVEAGAIPVETVKEMLAEQKDSLLGEVKTLLAEHETGEEERVQEELSRRDLHRALAVKAAELIESAEGLTEGWKAELKAKYVLLPSGPSRALELCEGDDDTTPDEALRESVEADVKRANELIRETKEEPKPTGLGASEEVAEQEAGKVAKIKPGQNEFLDFLVESGQAADHDAAVTKIREAVNG